MLSLQFIRENPGVVRDAARNKGVADAPIDRILELDSRLRSLIQATETRAAEQNRLSKAVGPAIGRAKAEGRAAADVPELRHLEALKAELRGFEAERTEVQRELDRLLLEIPNIHAPEVPLGADESGNVEVRTWGVRPAFDFPAQPHYEIGERMGIMDFERGAKVAGSRFLFLKGEGARLERGLAQFMLDLQTRRHGYTEVQPPVLVNSDAMTGTANLPKFADEAFRVQDRDFWLAPTAEVPVTNMYRDEILDGANLPIQHVAFSPCFRSEAGAAGKDTRGYVRLHQFNKVEMVKFTTPETSGEEHEALTRDAETVLQELELPYRVLLMCTGDLGFAQYKKYDIEAWAPGLGRYLEVSSCSVFGDFQARRANIRYRPEPGAKPRFVHTINGSGLALPRTVAALMEVHQQANGTVTIPTALRPYMDGRDHLGEATPA